MFSGAAFSIAGINVVSAARLAGEAGPIEQSVRDMNEAFAWLPQSAYAAEAKPLAELTRKKHRGVKHIGDLIIPLLLRLGVTIEEEPKEVESKTSEARSSD